MNPDGAAEETWEGLRRERCPRCGDYDTIALLIGDVIGVSPEMPDWVRIQGCIDEGYEHECRICGHRWGSAWFDD